MRYTYFYPTLDCLSSDLFQKLTAKDLKVLNQLFILFRMARKNLTTKYVYIQPSQKWIKGKTNYSIEGISRSITKLTQLGVIRTTHRRMAYGRWQTNLYHLGETILMKVPWLRKALIKKGYSPFDQTGKLEDQKPLMKDSDTEELINFREWIQLSKWKPPWKKVGKEKIKV